MIKQPNEVLTFKPLSRDDIVALKHADHVVITMVYTHGKPNIGRLTAAKQITPQEFKTWEIVVLSSMIFLDDSLIIDNAECQFVIPNSSLNWLFQTSVGQLFPGDELELIWRPDAESNAEAVAEGWHCDTLQWIIYRKQFRFHYTLGTKLSKEDKHRMIRPQLIHL